MVDNLFKLKKEIKNLSYYQINEIYSIIKKNTDSYTENRNGLFIDMRNLDNTIIDKLNKFIEYSKNNRAILEKKKKALINERKNIFENTGMNKSMISRNIIVRDIEEENTSDIYKSILSADGYIKKENNVEYSVINTHKRGKTIYLSSVKDKILKNLKRNKKKSELININSRYNSRLRRKKYTRNTDNKMNTRNKRGNTTISKKINMIDCSDSNFDDNMDVSSDDSCHENDDSDDNDELSEENDESDEDESDHDEDEDEDDDEEDDDNDEDEDD